MLSKANIWQNTVKTMLYETGFQLVLNCELKYIKTSFKDGDLAR